MTNTPALPLPRRGLPPPLELECIDAVVRPALAEDTGAGDLTSLHAVPVVSRARATLVAKRPGVLAGLAVFLRAFELCDPTCRVEALMADGDALHKGARVATIEGARAIGLDADLGSIESGKVADLVVLDVMLPDGNGFDKYVSHTANDAMGLVLPFYSASN